ncbi:hypothetical protein FH608_030010 [Nonomuraea phyllanthi]|uniref:Uncharacterized protein n=1 Tax=Nonomuraea phyllanthi TaxID=2219224 RepID=A0A5C4W1M6_9ACTN|nr:hypothetical protein [Nonomuraea phyllanthi]KAB8191495.1 hypothetical protein FH608_030010 [Nonomuraea phyllanthi]
MKAVTAVNAVLAVGSMTSAVIGLVKPGLILPGSEVSAGVELYAARALPLGAGLLYALTSRARPGLLVPMLTMAGVVQLADALIGLGQGIPGMMAGGTVCAIGHLASAWILRDRGRERSISMDSAPSRA